ncbi:MAG: superoxide dismutase [Ni] [Fidelibacterota bacterium]
MKKILLLTGVFLLCLIPASLVMAHCEIPCGIYGDSMRVALIREHVETIEKSMNEINTISKEKNPDYNQLVRWVNNKELHAEKIQEIISQYFLHQRIKTVKISEKGYSDYTTKLELLHRILVSAMKCKQGTDLAEPSRLEYYLSLFEDAYFHEH